MIDERNIELRIFEYHEDLLDAGQKEELMAYLHEHPEWQRDFAVWAQSRLHASVPAVPAFQAQLLRKSPLFPLWAKYSLSLATATLCVLTWYWWPKAERANQPLIEQAAKQDSAFHVTQEKIVSEKSQDKLEKEFASPKVNKGSSLAIPQASHAMEDELKPTGPTSSIISSDTLVPFLPRDTVATPTATERKETVQIPSKKVIAAADSLAKQEPEKALPKKERKKVKHKFSLKPTSDIVPTNSNF